MDIKIIIETKNNNDKKDKNFQFKRKNVNNMIFEFGITTKENDNSFYLYQRKYDAWGITGYA